MFDEQSEDIPRTISKWDVFALFTDSLSDMAIVISNFFAVLTMMLDTKATFVDDQKSFHEYAARTIETLREGE